MSKDPYRKIEGRSLSELRQLVAEDNDRFDQLEEAWHDLTADEQMALVGIAQSMAAGEVAS